MNTDRDPRATRTERGVATPATWPMQALQAHLPTRAALTLALLGALAGPAAAAPPPALSDAPAWVTPVAPDPARTVKNATYGVDYLLSDSQTRVAPDGTRQNFRHVSMRVRTTKGLDQTGQLEIEWDPTYQRMQLHQLRVLRDGRWLPWRERASARTLDREPEAEQRIYDGRKTMVLQLDDIRVGDVLEYAYSVSGWNPVYAGKQFGGFALDYGVPIAHLHNRLLMPARREITVQAPPGTPVDRRTTADGQQELIWDATDIAAVQREKNTPSWFDPWSEVRWTEFRDWGDVARWGAPLYQPPARLSAPLRAEVDRIAAAYTAPADRAAAVLRLVQEQVRYLSISMGTGSHAPRAPDRVFAQRFGDCKDKSLLSVALMRALGLEANVALVHTERREKLADLLPSAGVFDHAIVQVVVDGKTYWLDPTRAPQRARLDAVAPADFGQALVLSPATTGLTAMEVGDAALNRRRIAVVYDLSAGPGKRAGFEVTTRYEGAAAEFMRNGTLSENLPEYASKAQKYYAQWKGLAGIQPLEALEWDDDEAANVITVRERYDIDDPWQRDKNGRPTRAGLPSAETEDALHKPEIALRKQPLAFQRGADLVVTIEERLPGSWAPRRKETDVQTFNGQAFSYLREFRSDGHEVHLTETFRSKADHVPVAELAAHVKTIEQAAEWVGHDLTWGGEGAASARSGHELGRAGAALAGLLVVWVGSFHGLNWLRRRRAQARPAPIFTAAEPPTPPAHQSPDAPSSPDRH